MNTPRLKKPHKGNAGYGTLELLLFLLAVTGIIAANIMPIQRELKEMESTRTKAAEAEINYQKQRYLFESTPTKIEEFNRAGDQTRWEILSERVIRDGKNVRDPYAFIRFSGKSQLFIGRDSEAVLLTP